MHFEHTTDGEAHFKNYSSVYQDPFKRKVEEHELGASIRSLQFTFKARISNIFQRILLRIRNVLAVANLYVSQTAHFICIG